METRILLASALLAGSVLLAQEYRGTFSGSVTDAQGAAIPNVKVVATETRTGTNAATTSRGHGRVHHSISRYRNL